MHLPRASLLNAVLLLSPIPAVEAAASPWTLNHQQTLGASPKQPNIVFILTDDQDLQMESLDYMPFLKKHLLDQGTLYEKHFCTTALCCPSRVSLLTGKLAHNTNVTDVNPPYGGYPKFISQGFNQAYLPIWLQEAGYSTYYAGKLFNAHTTDNYNSPHVAGWTGSDFLLDPYTYDYLNASYQRNFDPPVSYEGHHTVDVLANKSLGQLDDAVKQGKPFFLGIAPIAPHSNFRIKRKGYIENPDELAKLLVASPPVSAERHAHLFADVKVPRNPNFNPDSPSGVSWVAKLNKLSDEDVEYNDHFYRQRLRALQSVDELIDRLFARLERYGLLDNTYIFYSADNGYHIGQHRLQPGKECGFEEDVNVPLVVRGPGVPANHTTDIVTAHVDLAPTFLELAGGRQQADFDGSAVPLTHHGLEAAVQTRQEHVNIEYWGFALSEGHDFQGLGSRLVLNNTYKALRVYGESHNLYYSVYCSGEHELYDLASDPYQIDNLLAPGSNARSVRGVPLEKLVSRLDSLLFVLKSCKADSCRQPWEALHPQGNVASLSDALSSRFDELYTAQKRVEFDHCEMGYLIDAEGPQFETDGLFWRQGLRWSEWT